MRARQDKGEDKEKREKMSETRRQEGRNKEKGDVSAGTKQACAKARSCTFEGVQVNTEFIQQRTKIGNLTAARRPNGKPNDP